MAKCKILGQDTVLCLQSGADDLDPGKTTVVNILMNCFFYFFSNALSRQKFLSDFC